MSQIGGKRPLEPIYFRLLKAFHFDAMVGGSDQAGEQIFRLLRPGMSEIVREVGCLLTELDPTATIR